MPLVFPGAARIQLRRSMHPSRMMRTKASSAWARSSVPDPFLASLAYRRPMMKMTTTTSWLALAALATLTLACSRGDKKPAAGPDDEATGAAAAGERETAESSGLSPREKLKRRAKKRREECDEVRTAIEAVSARAQLVGINNAGTLKKVAEDIAEGAKGLRAVAVEDEAVGRARDAYLKVLDEEVTILTEASQSSGALLREKVKAFEAMEASLEELLPDIEQACTAPLTES
ncbi:MAG: hypothetical protein AAGA56_27835 [Myxococcota bacterium]